MLLIPPDTLIWEHLIYVYKCTKHTVFIKNVHYIQDYLLPHFPFYLEVTTELWSVFCRLPPGELD